jgi:hypothetical protein
MTHISLTSGEIFDIITALSDKCEAAHDREDEHLAAYYLNIIQQFDEISYKLQDLPGENRVANLVLAAN